MSANIQALYDNNRVSLYDKIPLCAPMSVSIETSSCCNLRCKYCAQSLGEGFEQRHFHRELMHWDTFQLVLEQLEEFEGNIQKIHLFRNGEPLLNPELPRMIRALRERQVCRSININTNAVLLSHDLALALIDAGLDTLCVSMQGMSRASYQEISGVPVDFDQLCEQLHFFYQNRRQCKLFIKNIDIALGDGDEAAFYRRFGECADRVYVERACPVYESVDYTGMLIQEDVTRHGEAVGPIRVCQLVFYYLHILSNGDIHPCSSIEFPMAAPNIRQTTLKEFWNGPERRAFLRQHAAGKRMENPVCRTCKRLEQEFQPADSLDAYSDELLKKLR